MRFYSLFLRFKCKIHFVTFFFQTLALVAETTSSSKSWSCPLFQDILFKIKCLVQGPDKALFTSEYKEFKSASDLHRQALLCQVVGIPRKCKITYVSWRKPKYVTIKLHKK